ncbi:MAG: beta-N-acetylglucosaminidase domain-containing protein [bacterium]
MKKSFLIVAAAAAFLLFSASAQAFVLLPAPQKILKQGGALKIDPSKVVVSEQIGKDDPRILAGLKEIFPNLTVGKPPAKPAPGSLFIHAAASLDAFAKQNCASMGCAGIDLAAFKPQEYFLGVRKNGAGAAALILFRRSKTENGVGDCYGEYYATRTLKQLYGAGALPEISIRDWPEFGVRGVLEGFYGKPWPEANRISMIPWMGDVKMNIYLYTPKDDEKLRFGWRAPLSKKELKKVFDLNKLASDHFVKYCWSLSPGVSINFSSPKDMKAAYNKYKSALDQGVRCFTIAFDDVGPTLSPYDRGKFATYWEGQVSFVNTVIGKLMDDYPDATFAFVPNDYWGSLARGSEYLRYVGEHLDKRMSVGWTGTEIIPLTVTPEDAIFYSYFIKRKPFLGDNYPVTDNITKVGGRISVGPLRSRDPRLFRYVTGFAANGSPLPEISKPPFMTIADFTWNPFNYDPDESWIRTSKLIAGEDKYQTFDFFSKQTESGFIWPYDAMDLFEQTRAVAMAFDKKPDYAMAAAAPALRKTFTRFAGIDKEMETIRNQNNAAMLDEIEQWILKLKMYGVVGLKTLDLLDRKSGGASVAESEIADVEKEWQDGEKNTSIMTEMVMKNFVKQALALLRGQEAPKPDKLKTLMSN